MTSWRHFAATDINRRNRDMPNSDAYACGRDVFAVADGVSRSNEPGAAARAAAGYAVTAEGTVDWRLFPPMPPKGARDWARNVIDRAHTLACRAGGKTTLTGLRFFEEDEEHATIVVFHVGDSALLRVSGDKVVKMTTDHTVVEGLVRAGEISREEAKRHPYRHVICSALGGTLADVQVRGPVKVSTADALVLCSDGVHGDLTGADVVRCMAAEDPAKALIEAARAAGATDDATAIVLLGPRFRPVC